MRRLPRKRDQHTSRRCRSKHVTFNMFNTATFVAIGAENAHDFTVGKPKTGTIAWGNRRPLRIARAVAVAGRVGALMTTMMGMAADFAAQA